MSLATTREWSPVAEGRIMKALSGFYYVDTGDKTVRCRARGRFRHDNIAPLVGDNVSFTEVGDGEGVVDGILPRRNMFIRPPVANIDKLVIIAANVIPVTDPFLIDRMAAIAGHAGAEVVICLNKCDLDRADRLFDIYSSSGFHTVRASAVTGEGIEELKSALKGHFSVFTGNAIDPSFQIPVGDVSVKLGRGRHTTRHVEIFRTPDNALIADTPGFSAFDLEKMELTSPEELQYAFREFSPYIGECRFVGCSHVKEKGCAVLEAVKSGAINPSRHKSYVRLYEQLSSINEWERK